MGLTIQANLLAMGDTTLMTKPFNISFPTPGGRESPSELAAGDTLFVLGPNGSGKSSLMLYFDAQNPIRSRRILAHRQTWMRTDALDMTPENKLQTERGIRSVDHSQQSRYRDDYAAERASIAIYNLVDAQNIRARKIADCADAGDLEAVERAAQKKAPINAINELLLQANLPITISIHENARLMASKNGGPEYSAAWLSDGERNALLVACTVLTAPRETLLIIDEPERHLHRSIISPLLGQLFGLRKDCAFVISTHDHGLPLATPGARVLLLRKCTYADQNAQNWEADELPTDTPIDDQLKRDLLGARRNVLFVEGTESSLDKQLYRLVFPKATVIPKGSWRDVERAVKGVRAANTLHWLRAFGIIDGDGNEAAEGTASCVDGVYTLPVYSVEAIYYHPWILNKIAQQQADATGDAHAYLRDKAISEGVNAIRTDTERLGSIASKKLVRKAIHEQIPNDDKLLAGDPVTLENPANTILTARTRELNQAVEDGDWGALVAKCSVQKSSALGKIATELGFRGRGDYEKVVRRLLEKDDEAVEFVRKLFGDLCDHLTAEPFAQL